MTERPSSCPPIAELLSAWFADHARDLPWRRDRTPYRTWLSEVMLQQTRVETVIPYYERFLTRFPTIESLAQAPLEEVLRLWEGLGYYARARNLHAASRAVVEGRGGRLPSTYEGLLELPGLGPYTAGAVASLAFGRDVAAVDGNARRVLVRVHAIDDDVTRAATQRQVDALGRALLPPGAAGPFNEALIELGATICKRRAPRCGDCPLRSVCRAHAEGDAERLPIRRKRRAVPHFNVTAAVTLRAGRVLITRRNQDDMLGGLWEFPGGKVETGETLEACLVREMREELGVDVRTSDRLVVVKHAYSHFRMTLHAYLCSLESGTPECLECAAYRWIEPASLGGVPMSVADRRVADALIARLRSPGKTIER